MANPAKIKGTAGETAFVNYLVPNGFPGAERRALSGAYDQGDVTGTPGLVWEVKNCKKYTIPKWLRETETERFNANADFGILIVKPNGVGINNVANWWAVMTTEMMMKLVTEAGVMGRIRTHIEGGNDIAALMKEMQENLDDHAEFNILCVIPRNFKKLPMGQYWEILPVSEMVRLVRMAGYGDALK